MAEKSKRWVAVLRTLHQSEKLNKVSEGAELLYRRLLEVCDDGGNYYAEPNLLLGYVFAHRMSHGLTVEQITERRKELEAAGLIVLYRDGELLHVCNHFTKMRYDGHGTTIMFDPPDATGTPTGDRAESKGLPRLDKIRLDKSPCASTSSSSLVDKKVQDRTTVLKWTDWFYRVYAETVGSPSPDAPIDGRRTVQDQNAAKKLERQGAELDVVEVQLRGWLRGEYFKATGSTLANFVAVLGSLTEANRKKGAGNSTPPPPKNLTPQQRAAVEAERRRLAAQTECAAQVRFRQRTREGCGGSGDKCRGCPQLHVENPGAERSRSAVGRGLRHDGELKPVAETLPRE